MHDRRKILFHPRMDALAEWEQAASIVSRSGCQDVGLFFHGDEWQYPLWLFLQELEVGPIPRIRHVSAPNPSKKLQEAGTP